MKGIFLDDNMSNLTSASNEAAASLSSSSNRNEIGTMYPPPQMQHQSFTSVPITTTNNNQTQSSNKKKRNLPGNPDPEAEIIALSPKSLMATNRFLCEICNKGFQRDQNLQLHRRGHNLPWKLKQKSKLEVVRKKVYVCPEPSCVHHEPSRALGDLTGIKKHYSRKHGEKKWKCEKCSKRYAVQSDWKAHSKICGTREYRCDCGTLFSRRDSFITHRAFCDALAEESGRFSSSTLTNNLPLHLPLNFPLKSEPQLLLQHPQLSFNIGSSTSHHNHHQLPSWLNNHPQNQEENPNPNSNHLHHLPSPHSSSHMLSATALLQKAAQMGVTMSNNNNNNPDDHQQHPPPSTAIILNGSHQTLQQQHDHMCAPLLSSHHHPSGLLSNLSSSDHNIHHVTMLDQNCGFANVTTSCMDQLLHPNNNNSSFANSTGLIQRSSTTNIHDMIFNGMFNSSTKKLDGGNDQNNNNSNNNELTRDFLGLQAFPNDQQFLNMSGLDHMSQLNPSHNPNHNPNQIPWQG